MSDAIDERLAQALDQGRYRATQLLHLEQLKLKLHQDLTLAYDGGLFKASPELIGFAVALLASGHGTAVLLDVNERPVVINHLQEFATLLTSTYNQVIHAYLTEHKRLSQARTVAELIG